MCLGHAGLRVHGAVQAEVIGRQLVPIRQTVEKSCTCEEGEEEGERMAGCVVEEAQWDPSGNVGGQQ